MKKLLITLLAFVFTSATFADKVTEQQALQKAQQFFKDKKIVSKNPRRVARAGQQQSAVQEDFYIFNVEDNGGFVIVSGDDRTEEILGYSDNGHIDLDNIPENVREWFDSYSKQIKALDDIPEVQKVQRSDKPAIAPLIKTQWGQGDPYNRMCPAIDGSHCLTGCGATAMAQIVYYWRDYIKNVYTIPGYVTYREKINMPELPSTELDWDKMQQSFSLYYQPRTDESKDAVAKLMLYCGQSVRMDYGLNESGGGPSGGELVKYFGFSENLKKIYRDKYSHIWEDIIYKELSAERPVYYEGSTYCQRHAFICDGYDGEGRFHINWGWNGDCDGFFKLSLYGNYSSSHSAIIGIRPSSYDEKTESFPIANCILDVVKQAYNRSSLDNDFVGINISGKVTTSIDIPNIEYAWSLYSDNEQIKVFDTISGIGKANESQILNSTIDFGSGISSGKYQLRLICRINRESDWILVGNSDDCYIIEIDGNSLYTRGVKNDFEITGIEYSGKFLRNHDVKMKISIKNNGETYYWPFYIKDDKETLFKITAYILPDQSDDIVVDYRPKHNGKIKIMISDNPNFSGNLCYEDEIEIGEAPEQDLQLNLSVRGARNNTVSDTELDVDVKIKNVGTITFDDDIIFTYEIGFNEEKHPVRIEPGDSAILSFHVDNLTKGKIYNFIVLYYKNSDIYRMGQSVECLVGFDLFESHLEAKINVKNPLYDAKNNIIFDTYPELELEVKNNDDYEYIDKIYFYWFHWLNEKGSGPGVVGEPHDVYLKGGERIKIPIVFRDKETPWDVYTVQASYVSERVEKNFFPSFVWYTMKRELPVSKVYMDFVELNADEPREVDLCLDICGLKCTNLEFDMQLPDGVELETNDDNSIYYVPGPIVKEMDAIRKEGNLYHFVMTMSDTWENQESSQSFVKVRIRLVDKLYHGIYNVLFSNVECRYLEREFPCEEVYSKIKVENNVKGDVNGDGTVDIADAVCIVNHVVGKATPTFVEAAADVNGDGVVDIADAVKIVNLVVGKIETLSRKQGL